MTDVEKEFADHRNKMDQSLRNLHLVVVLFFIVTIIECVVIATFFWK